MAEWSADVVVGGDLARRLIAYQFPAVELRTLRLLAEGWDNTVWLADERWVFRFPRRELALPGFERELAVLPRLAPLLPLPIPDPVFRGRPAHGFPWRFFGAALIPGREVADAALDGPARARLARPLGEFLRALHSIPPAIVGGRRPAVEGRDRPAVGVPLPADPFRRADMERRVPQTEARFAELARHGLWRPPPGVREVLDAARALPAAEATVVAHGDLHVRHLLVGPDGAAAGVIDWGDVCAGDPAIDLPLYWCLLPPAARPEFLAAYGPVPEAALLRARVLALFLSGTLAVYARLEGLPALEREAVAGLERAAH
jgi:aminoglycoside phosphotransferase (APT) family kinase protein